MTTSDNVDTGDARTADWPLERMFLANADTCDARPAGWPLERMLFAIGGTVVIIAAILALTVSIWFVLLAAFAGVNQWLYVLFGDCPMSLFLNRALHVKRRVSS